MTFVFPEPAVEPLRGGPVLRWGVIGPGEIANDFTGTLHANSDQRVVAVGSRSAERAAAFAARHGVPSAHDSYEALVADPAVDVVYVASPHPQHLEHALLAIAAGKHVLVEKPMTTSGADTRRLAAAAREAGVLAMEAMWTRYLPGTTVVARLLADGTLGDVRLATVDVGWPHDPADPGDRMFDPAAGGGALLDAGVYSHWFARFATGAPVTSRTTGAVSDGGVDLQSVTVSRATGGAQAVVTTSITAWTPGLAMIAGSAATLRYTDHFVFPASFAVHRGADADRWSEPTGLRGRQGLVWQAAALARYVADGRTDSPVHSLNDAIGVAEALDAARAALDVPQQDTSAP
ncbi:Gfo/Idh/MocA family oxidoreductase [Curtobacterium sp. MCLR17_007]|uniref:Gfo/Idh/MocA family protein n=1 Tax=Curtobacterium sp. MCLR17_007 TaxID=2175648 RepID=UPI000DA9F301|nr:Gfo/Idh/MocA family oxidoreductase [Curtobacterium sp. MCLR17_007]WIB58865.1 Gfo/Idh/MocA family oxidoreductase [Curtobacterium sp. MCLR17_007]